MDARFTPEFQRRTIVKVAWRLLPLVVVAYLVAYIDRTNIAVAALTMNKDLGIQRLLVWDRSGHLLHRLRPVRSAEQHDSGEGRRAHVDCANHDHLGHRFRVDGHGRRPLEFSLVALSARRGRSRLLPRNDPLLHLLVSRPIPRARHLDAVHRGAGGECRGLGAFGRDPGDGRHPRAQGLAVGLHHRSHPCGAARLRRTAVHDRSSRGGEMARRGREGMARRRTAGRSAPRSTPPAS